jgi:hypothetical protein
MPLNLLKEMVYAVEIAKDVQVVVMIKKIT